MTNKSQVTITKTLNRTRVLILPTYESIDGQNGCVEGSVQMGLREVYRLTRVGQVGEFGPSAYHLGLNLAYQHLRVVENKLRQVSEAIKDALEVGQGENQNKEK